MFSHPYTHILMLQISVTHFHACDKKNTKVETIRFFKNSKAARTPAGSPDTAKDFVSFPPSLFFHLRKNHFLWPTELMILCPYVFASTSFLYFAKVYLLSKKSGNKATFLKTGLSAPFKMVCVVSRYPETSDREWPPHQGTAVGRSHFRVCFLLS